MKKLILFLSALSVGFLILSKIMIYQDCYSFDNHDDANHAFPNLTIARQALSMGEIPTINYFNNFGAPILGDALTYPYSLQSISYYFFKNPVAMTLNRVLMVLATFFFSYLFFRIFLSFLPAFVCSLLSEFNPVSFWYPVHHYQMATPLFFLSLYLMNRFLQKKSKVDFVLMFFLFIVLFLSVSINLVGLMLPFFIAWSLTRNSFKLDRYFFAPLFSFISALLATAPQTIDFVRNFMISARAGEGVYESILTNARELFLGLLIPPGEWIAYNYGAQLQVTSYISVPILLTLFTSLFLIHKKRIWKQSSLFLCGFLPTLICIGLYVSTRIRFSIPLLKSMDISRLLWFSLPFCFVYVGYFISYLRSGLIPKWILLTIISINFALAAILKFTSETADVSSLHFFIFIIFGFGLLLVYISQNPKMDFELKSKVQFLGFVFAVFGVLLTPVPVIVRVLGLNIQTCEGTQYSNNFEQSRFMPGFLIDKMTKNNRVATEIHTHKGQDLRAAMDGIFGSDARAIVVHKQFGKYLEAKHLVTVDQIPYGYYFSRPWQTNELSKLGIRYLLIGKAKDPELDSKNWTFLGGDLDHSLYENPSQPTPVYLKDDQSDALRFVQDFNVQGNHFNIQLPEVTHSSTLVLTILNRYGMFAKIDNQETEINNDEYGFINLKIQKGQKTVEIWHQPYSYLFVLSGFILSLVMILFYSSFLRQVVIRESK